MAGAGPSDRGLRRGAHQYGAVLVLAVVTVGFGIAAPESDLSRGVGIALQASTLFVVLLTSDSPRLRYAGAPVALFAVAAAALAAAGVLSGGLSHAYWGALALAALVECALGSIRLLRAAGVTRDTVMGGVAVYVLLGLVFALVTSVAAARSNGRWFSHVTDGTLGDRIYASFATLTLTGFGDFAPATAAGRALSVTESLTGQLYVVTVVALLAGSLRQRTN